MEKKFKILIAEDDAEDVDIFRKALSKAGIDYDLVALTNGQKLLAYISELPAASLPDIIFLDSSMPFVNGFECLEALRNQPELDALPVLILSQSDEPAHVDRAYSLGATAYVSKPMSMEENAQLIKKIFALDWQEILEKRNKKDFVIEVDKGKPLSR